MKYYIINHSFDSYVKTKEYCGFINKDERNIVNIGDYIIYFGQGVIFGIFEAIDLVDNEFNNWKGNYPYQIKLKPIYLSQRGILAKTFSEKFKLLREDNQYRNIVELNEDEYILIKNSILENKKEIKVV
ncbi:MAG: hypothetical protein PHR26_02345 [Candidatus ainarchaeum sp.]|nr:hypothetical protein [Candidatus ainarchaeum sp.]MDD3975904.1 hypothetical protein [Candidatus ainarchaeum sp.]